MFTKLYGEDKVCYNLLHFGDIKHVVYEILNVDPKKSYILKTNEIEVGPKTSYKTPWCSNMIEILKRIGVINITHIEKSIIMEKGDDYDKLTMEIYPRDGFNIFTKESGESNIPINFIDIDTCNREMDLGIPPDIVNYYKTFLKYPTNIELYDLAQCNSEHSRHTFFCGNIIIDGNTEKSLMSRVKDTINYSNKNNTIAFKDNSSSINGFIANKIFVSKNNNNYNTKPVLVDFTHNAETHNFPTCISPFEGANTGTGGRIRDTIAVGRGGNFVSGIVGYAVGNIENDLNLKYPYKLPVDLLIEASNGCSDYGNKIGEPVTSGFARSFYGLIDGERVENIKPILYSAGNGFLLNKNNDKKEGEINNLIVRVGGPAYPIGMGGGAASSRDQNTENNESDFLAVQRGDPQMENKLCRFVRVCAEMLDENPILSIHDQGSGGMANVTKEIIEPCGAIVSLNNVNKGCSRMGVFEVWNAEFQEQCSILIHPKNIGLVKEIASRECVDLEFVGFLTKTSYINCYDSSSESMPYPIQLNLDKALYNFPKKNVEIKIPNEKMFNNENQYHIDFTQASQMVLDTLDVGSKNFLTHKVDRSVTGLIAQQQCVGPFHVPLSDYSINALDFYSTHGVCSAIAERPLNGIRSIKSMVEITVGELLTNMIFCPVSKLKDIKILTNWMWSIKLNGGDYKLYKAVDYLTNILNKLGIAVDGGKDSLSMNIKFDEECVPSLNTLVLKSYVPCVDFTKAITPEFKHAGNPIFFVDLGYGNQKMGGSILSKCLNMFDYNKNDHPIFHEVTIFKNVWDMIQLLIQKNIVLSGHDRSDGGLFTTLTEMSISSNLGVIIDIKTNLYETDIEYFFNEELGLVLEVDINKIDMFYDIVSKFTFNNYKINSIVKKIGVIIDDPRITYSFNNKNVYKDSIVNLRMKWEKTSYDIDKKQSNPKTALAEYNGIKDRKPPIFHIPNKLLESLNNTNLNNLSSKKPIVGIIREVGSNGDKEMAAAFIHAGFEAIDITMSEICKGSGDILEKLNGIAFVGGFSFSDVAGSATGWYSQIVNNNNIKTAFDRFYNDPYKFALGICNGCQLMTKLGWVGNGNWKLVENKSNIFESRFPTVKVKNNSIFTRNMDECIFGIWSAHGEGRFVKTSHNDKSDHDLNHALDSISIQYVDDDGIPTDRYPMNPNSSIYGTAALTSQSGRHLAIMPHPERCFLQWQSPYIPNDVKEKIRNTKYTPWFILFKNAYEFCLQHM